MVKPPPKVACVRITLDMLYFIDDDSPGGAAEIQAEKMMEAAQEGLLREFAGRDVSAQFEVWVFGAAAVLE